MIHAQGETETEHAATVENPVNPVTAVPQEQTLHDFVTNLLNDAAARDAFAHDPAKALGMAGLDDITAEDVQDVVPLVMDYTELPGTDAITEPAGAVSGLDGAIEQLRSVADAAVGERDELAGTADLTSDAGGVLAGGAAGLDGVTGAARWATDVASGEATGRLSDEGLSLGAVTDTVAGRAAGMGGVGLESSGGMVNADTLAGSGSGMVDAGLDGVTGNGGVDTDHLDAAVFGQADTQGAEGGAGLRTDAVTAEGVADVSAERLDVNGSLETPFGSYGVDLTGEPTLSVPELDTTGDLADTLDTDTITRGSEAAASTVVTYVASGGAALHGVARSATDELPVDVPAGVPAADLPVDVPVDVPAVPVDAASAPGVDDAVLSEPRDVVPDINEPLQVADIDSNLPNVGGSVYDLASEVHSSLTSVPGDLGFAVPNETPEMPELPVVNPLPESAGEAKSDITEATEQVPGVSNVTDTVSDSPLGTVTEKGEDVLSDAPVVGDLGLGS
ncbi:IniB N-terminal domain-containing protein [Saccharomonospora piscinae]|uniref:IniB N-terminal domain-containing protein n=1 Tax=Saccharomonospora piscinae TaxID=687388 RepID=UPI0015941603|nr:IniB N-terminal domain-containing protein [Saccharomonospora piscinae]